MTKENNNSAASNSTTIKSTRFPGIDDSLIIPSSPIFIKENSYKPVTKDKKRNNFISFLIKLLYSKC